LKIDQFWLSMAFIFVPGHVWVNGNEQADRLAAMAAISNGCAMDHADVFHARLEAGRVQDSLEDGYSSTVESLRESQVKLDTARHEHFSGSRIRVVN
jgi:hypothetical protein